MEENQLVKALRGCIRDAGSPWVLFENGTCVFLQQPQDDLAAQAISFLREYGPVHAGSSSGDFGTITLEDGRGWIVTSHHAGIVTFVGPGEVDTNASDLMVGLLGRSKRGKDSEELRVLHVEKQKRDQSAGR